MSICELCEREVPKTTKHHLIPKCRHQNKKNRKNFNRSEVRGRLLLICGDCHKQIHAIFTEKELEYDYNSKEKLLQHHEVVKFVGWISKKNIYSKVTVRNRREL